ncbi:cell division protein FtsZ [Sungkyunkwania multivorans]|uniref:Cell division protein FtsZ n=1 Tax=Sungkyunkwania multivorans TaxID=1173618 RepID=A0ABW3D2D6_9FLAO
MSSADSFENIAFDLPKNKSNVIKVIGVGGGGSNAINHMFQQGIKGVDFVICNTDAQALESSAIPNKIQLGVSLTEGLGAGANPQVGEQAALESYEELKAMLDTNTKMVFVTAGMGGGTGTGAAPIIAKLAKEMDILTVGIVTSPFQFEGKARNEQAQKGIEKLRSHVDSLVVINNNKLREVYGNLGFKAGFSKADEVLSTAARGIAEVITHHYTQNIDLRDAKTVLSNSGTSIMGSATATGTNRAQEAIMKALDSPLLNDNKITGAKNVLLLIVSGSDEITLDEIGEINDHIQTEAGFGANIIMGVGEDEALEDAISVTIIATGFDADQQHEIINTEAKKIIHTLEDEQKATHDLTPKSNKVKTNSIFDIEVNQPEEILPETKQVRHVLEEEKFVSEMELVPTTELLRNIQVTYEEVKADIENEDFIIKPVKSIFDIEVVDPETVVAETEDEQQFTLTFDLPINQSKTKEPESEIVSKSVDAIRDIKVNDPQEIIPEESEKLAAVKRYSLEDYMEMEDQLTKAKAKKVVSKVAEEEEVVFEKKTIAPEQKETKEVEIDPFNHSIEESLRLRADERRKKLKDFNYKFNNNISKIDEIEKQPAYKRAGIDLNESNTDEGDVSRMSVSTDSNDEVQLRSNNSFLHDNVD